jgi:hypothetical protein
MKLRTPAVQAVITVALIGSGIVSPGPVTAADGVLEINQACAVNTGCFAGDAASFPVTITQPGSYRLTGNLDLTSTPNTDAIVLQATVTLDLGGFSIQGPITCTGAGPTLSCGAGTGSGVLFDPSAQASVVRNGTVQGMGETGVGGDAHQIQIESIRAVNNGRDGVSAQGDTIIRQCTAFANGEDGVDVDAGSLVESTVAVGNGDDGVETDGPSTIVRGVSARGNGAAGVHTETFAVVSETTSSENAAEGFLLGAGARYRSNTSRANGVADDCGGGICSERRRYYLTQSSAFDGANALTACAAGFHMAAYREIRDTDNLAYDKLLGFNKDDSGEGPPANEFAWVRTGADSASSQNAGIANCNSWSQTSGYGSVVWLDSQWTGTSEASDPWKGSEYTCISPIGVWCVQDD